MVDGCVRCRQRSLGLLMGFADEGTIEFAAVTELRSFLLRPRLLALQENQHASSVGDGHMNVCPQLQAFDWLLRILDVTRDERSLLLVSLSRHGDR